MDPKHCEMCQDSDKTQNTKQVKSQTKNKQAKPKKMGKTKRTAQNETEMIAATTNKKQTIKKRTKQNKIGRTGNITTTTKQA